MRVNKRPKLVVSTLLIGVVAAVVLLFSLAANSAIFNPHGTVAEDERSLMLFALGLSLIVVIPVFAMTFWIVWKYREGNHKARYSPDWDHSRLAETIWWVVPTVLIAVLSVITWQSSHTLDPFRPLNVAAKPMTIQVVALDWKWLFIYPEQHIATVNYVQLPLNRPVDFAITADAPMNSFWIPQLGGQIYAMSGMSTHLHLMATEAGVYHGSSANISGRGFSGMQFIAKATTEADFRSWVNQVKQSPQPLDLTAYNQLAKPSENNPVAYYSSSQADLYDLILMKYMMPGMHVGEPV